MPVITKTPAPKKTRGRPKGSKKVISPWFKFICPKCGAEYGAMMESAEFSCYVNGCKGTICIKKGK